jgi:hypothetical protein
MERWSWIVSTVLVFSLLSNAQQTAPSAAATPSTPQQTPSAPANTTNSAEVETHFTSKLGFVLEDSVPVRLKLKQAISSATAHHSDTVEFEVVDDIYLNGVQVIAKGGTAIGIVGEAQAKRRMARGGKLDVNIDHLRLTDGESCPLRAAKGGNGGGHTGGMVAGMVVTGVVLWPVAPFFLLMHGKDMTIPAGTEITAYVNGDMKLELAKFDPNAPAPAPVATATAPATAAPEVASAAFAKLQMDSSIPGADILLDGNFVGNTPSEVQVAEGDHTVTVKKTGCKDWERKIKVTAGSSIHLSAEMEKEAEKTANP